MSAGASPSLGARASAGVDRRRGMALAASVGIHVLALLLWRQTPAPRVPQAARVVSMVLLPLAREREPVTAVSAPAASASASASAPASASASLATHSANKPPASTRTAPRSAQSATGGTPDATPPSTAVVSETPVAAAAAAAAASASASAPTTTAASDVAAESAPATPSTSPPGTPAGGIAYGIARHQAGRIDHALRGGKSGVPLQADTPWARFGRAIEAAHIDRSMSVREDEYTGPDGVVVYRFRQGNQTRCRRAGGVGLGIAGAPGVNDAGSIPCPSGAVWTPID